MAVRTERAFEIPASAMLSDFNDTSKAFDANNSTFAFSLQVSGAPQILDLAAATGGRQRAIIGVQVDWEVVVTFSGGHFEWGVRNVTTTLEELTTPRKVAMGRTTEIFYFSPSKRGSETRQGKAEFYIEWGGGDGTTGLSMRVYEVRFIIAPRGELMPVEGAA